MPYSDPYSPLDPAQALSQGQAWAVTLICLLNCALVAISSRERTHAIKKPPDSFSPSQLSLLWQHPCAFYWLWVTRAVVGIVSCLLPVPPMWTSFVVEEKTGVHHYAITWASCGVVACICGSIVSERLLYIGFADALGGEQVACIMATLTALGMLIAGEITSVVPRVVNKPSFAWLGLLTTLVVPLPLLWSLGGCAIHRLSMIIWWWLMMCKALGNEDLKSRSQMTFVGHIFSLLSVFMVFLPMFDSRLNQMLWLFACFFAVELCTTILTVRATYLVFQPEDLPCSELSTRPSSVDQTTTHPAHLQPVKQRDYSLSQMLRENSDDFPSNPMPREERMMLPRSGSKSGYSDAMMPAPVPMRVGSLRREKGSSDSSKTL